MNESPHKPVLLEETLDLLSPKQGDRYLDLTAGFGGHATKVAELIGEKGSLTLVDRDSTASKYLRKIFGQNKRTRVITDDFYSASVELLKQDMKFDCILADIGVSSHQIDSYERGFAFSKQGPLDMRMDAGQDHSAKNVVNDYKKDDLVRIFVNYGELSRKQAYKLSEKIITARPMYTTLELAKLASTIPHKRGKKIEAQVFQAIRIEVNDELRLLEKTLPVWAKLLATNGRLAVISFHSLEDRIVKQFFAQHSKNRYEADLKLLNKKPITAKKNEKVYNPRSRSALLRVAVKK